MTTGQILAIAVCLFAILAHLFYTRSQAQVIKASMPQTDEEYRRERRYFESVVFHLAYREKFVTKERIFQLIPEARHCVRCRSRINDVFTFEVDKGKLIIDSWGRARLTDQGIFSVVNADELEEELPGLCLIPWDDLEFGHEHCHQPIAA